MAEPDWAKVGYPPIDYQDAYYYAAPKDSAQSTRAWIDDVPQELLDTYEEARHPAERGRSPARR
jgi:Fe-S cluster assembly protein SufB